jgi:TRAP transporter TAXI family solute receptor
MVRQRYNAAIQRAKGLLELAASLYEGSLSFETKRPAEDVVQTDSRLGHKLKLALIATAKDGKDSISLSFAAHGFREIRAVANGRLSLAWLNASVALTLAYRGKGPFSKALPLRTIAVFPSYDIMGFAVHESTGITSLAEIKKKKFPLRLSTGRVTRGALVGSTTMFTVAAVLNAAGFSIADIRRWGGKIHSTPRPSDPGRQAVIENGTVDAVFDEGIKSWAQNALDHRFRFLPLEGKILQRLTAMGYRATVMPKSLFRGLPADIATIDFSGWPMLVRADMREDVAYALCEAIERRKDLMPTDNYEPLAVAQLCANDEQAPYDVPLHPGAERFYRERGYLK